MALRGNRNRIEMRQLAVVVALCITGCIVGSMPSIVVAQQPISFNPYVGHPPPHDTSNSEAIDGWIPHGPIMHSTPTIPTTEFSKERFHRTLSKLIADSLSEEEKSEAKRKAAANASVLKSRAKPKRLPIPKSALKPRPIELAFQKQKALDATADTAGPASVPRTAFDAPTFDQSLQKSLRSLVTIAGHQQASIQSSVNATLSLPVRQAMPDGDFRMAGHPEPSLENEKSREVSAEKDTSPAKKKPVPFDQPSGQSPGYCYNDFSPTPIPGAAGHFDAQRESWVYDAKSDVRTQKPLVELGREWYGNGITPNGLNWFGDTNLVRPKFYVYGDYRVGIIGGRDANGRTDNVSKRLNLDFDFQLTDTDRFHMFINPLEENGRNTRVELVDGNLESRAEINLTPATGFYEGDLGVLFGTLRNETSPFELPFTAGLIPLLFQNGIWMEDAVSGAAFALPARHSRLLNIANMDLTFFAGFDDIDSPAFESDSAAQVYGTAAFIEAYDGYIETGYAFLNERNSDDLDYHNLTVSFTRRYFDRLSNSVRLIINTGQDVAEADRTADGGILLVENSLITPRPLTWVPYVNFFFGWDRPQSVARAAGSGGLLRNTGINFQTDGVNGFAFLDDTGADTAGFALGVDLIGDQLDRQLVLEFAYQTPHDNSNANVPDDQFALGGRYQINLDHASLIRFDTMYGWRRGLDDIYGTRLEYRWKF